MQFIFEVLKMPQNLENTKNLKKKFEPIPEELEIIGKKIVEDKIICEIKAVDLVNPIWEAQVLSHLKLTNKRLGYLINFNVLNIGQGTRRFVV